MRAQAADTEDALYTMMRSLVAEGEGANWHIDRNASGGRRATVHHSNTKLETRGLSIDGDSRMNRLVVSPSAHIRVIASLHHLCINKVDEYKYLALSPARAMLHHLVVDGI